MKLKKDIFSESLTKTTENEIKKASYSLAMFSANIKRFLPNIPKSEYIQMYKDVFYYQNLSSKEQYDPEYLIKNKIINHSSVDIEDVNINTPTVFATFHLGAYRLLNCYLYERGHKIALIIDESVFMSQQEEMLRVCREELKGKKTSDMVILNVKDRTSIFKLKQLIEKGYVMTVYLDGNTGVNVKNQDFSKGYIPISFLESNIFVKNGVGKLAALLEAQFIPVVSYRDEDDINCMEFFKEIKTIDFITKQDFSIKTIEIAYKKLEEKLLKHPTQWECWLYIHKWFMRDVISPYVNVENICSYFNTDRYTTFLLGEAPFLFDLIDYQSYPIENKLFEAISKNNFKKIGSDLLEELAKKNIII